MQSLSLTSAHWTFRDATRRSAWRRAHLPGCVHTDLRRHGLIPDPFWGANELALQWIEERDWEYRTEFRLPAGFAAEETIELVADGLDTVATVTLNGHEVARTENMFVAGRWPVERWLRPGRNDLRIRFGSALRYIRTRRLAHRPVEINDPVGRCTVIRKQQCQFGWDWGPRFVTCGVWRDLRLEAWTGNRLAHVRVTQHHQPDGAVVLEFQPELARHDRGVRCAGTLSLEGRAVATIADGRAIVPRPALWWPNGHGAQPLYAAELVVHDDAGRPCGRWTRRLGLRTTALERKPDKWGESFRFVVNGRPIFVKGANWIPAHSFVAGLTRADYARDLRSAAAANMNMLRVWGGGIYESEDFYDLCDELGLLVWQDFMFSCTLYPADVAFCASVRAEAAHQVRRLHHRACLALWCGNNEIDQLNGEALAAPRVRRGYENIFHKILPDAVARHDGTTSYWPSSQWRGAPGPAKFTPAVHAEGERRGDTHFWDVWHARHPVKDYEKWRFRFVSEFGMQSYCSPQTQATFCPPTDANIFGPTMENHQKNRAGNQVILDYVSRRYRFPKDQEALVYLSQLNQAHCMQVGVEHYRRSMPRCMGALYWQLNDCWPVASWSSLEFTGQWKALHHAARRFFAPALVSAHMPGDETPGIGNYRASTVREVHLYTVYDAPGATRGTLRWDLFHLDGRRLLRGRKLVALRHGESVLQRTLDLAGPLAKFGRDRLYLRIALDVAGRTVSEETVLMAPPRFLELPRATTTAGFRQLTPSSVQVVFRAPVFQHRFSFELPPHSGIEMSDNYFDLYPHEPKIVVMNFSHPVLASQLEQSIRTRSLVDSYEC